MLGSIMMMVMILTGKCPHQPSYQDNLRMATIVEGVVTKMRMMMRR